MVRWFERLYELKHDSFGAEVKEYEFPMPLGVYRCEKVAYAGKDDALKSSVETPAPLIQGTIIQHWDAPIDLDALRNDFLKPDRTSRVKNIILRQIYCATRTEFYYAITHWHLIDLFLFSDTANVLWSSGDLPYYQDRWRDVAFSPNLDISTLSRLTYRVKKETHSTSGSAGTYSASHQLKLEYTLEYDLMVKCAQVDGSPVNNATVIIYDSTEKEVARKSVADDQLGHYAFSLLSDAYLVKALRGDEKTGDSFELSINLNSDSTLSFASFHAPGTPQYTLTVRTVDPDNNPISGVTVYVDTRQGTTNGSGNVSFTLYASPPDYKVLATKAGYESADTTVTLASDQIVTLTLKPTAKPGVPAVAIALGLGAAALTIGAIIYKMKK